ncbi:hypothetical protein OL548_03070 [Lysinibacillus sp. MHQ-1]|nr:hypothetical protein OL548_03070 [Lysinibacillus sp. MHQ-1]
MQQAQLLTDKIDSSQQFAHDLKNAAQLSNKTEVEKINYIHRHYYKI